MTIIRKIALSALTFLAIVGAAHASCPADHYVNVSGHCVQRPVHSNSVPQGATAHCRDGTYSFSEHHQGTCSHHGGVAAWLH